MLMQAEQASLLFIDVQQKLLPAIHQGEAVLDACLWLAGVAGALQLPVLLTEHYPRGLGATEPRLLQACGAAEVLEKIHFSAVADPCFAELRPRLRRQVVVGGAETHVCVLQTVLQLREQGYEVFVVDEAVGSRTPRNKELGLQRMAAAGAHIVSGEMVAFEWLARGGTPLFREVMQKYIR